MIKIGRRSVALQARNLALPCLCTLAVLSVHANPVSLSYLEGKLPVAPDAITSYGPDLFGDKINLFNGGLVFEHTDLSLPGNDSLPVALVRKHTPGQNPEVRGQFGDWDLETPRIGGSFSTIFGWVTSSGSVNRCSGGLLPPVVTSGNRAAGDNKNPAAAPAGPGAPKTAAPAASSPAVPGDAQRAAVSFIASDYWNGTYLHVPGQGSQEVLVRSSGYSAAPADGGSYPLVTHQNWQISCLGTIRNGAGEGFIAVSPQGVRYRFDWMATRAQTQVKKMGASIGRQDMFLMASEVSDRFGNWVRYTYDPSNPLLLTRIESRDGRIITVTNVGGRAVSASDGTRTFSYSYTSGYLTSAVRPDSSRWSFNLAPLVPDVGEWATIGEGANCDFPGEYPAKALTGTITHPSGAVGTFTTQYQLLGRSGVQRACKFITTRTSPTIGAVWPRYVVSSSLSAKQIAGPGMPTMRWTYAITAPGSWDSCTTCSDTRLVAVAEPNGGQTLHTFGNRWRVNEGQLLRVEEGWNGKSALRTTRYRYRNQSVAQAFPEQFGLSPLQNNDWLSSRHRPLDQKITRVQGTDFTWEVGEPGNPVAGFDSLVRPLLLRKHSAQALMRREAIVYSDNTVRWVLGQVRSVTELNSNLVQEEHVYDSDKAWLLNSSTFGKKNVSYTYNAGDGTLATVSDAANRATRLLSFKRGQPQRVIYPDSTEESQVINNLGNPDSRTNEAGTTTSYAYDTMGRVMTVTYPPGDTAAYNLTEQRFVQATGLAYNLAPGHWQQTITTGNARTERYFDALWRERLAVRYDIGRPTEPKSIVETRYDAAGRKVFKSYPLGSLASVDTTSAGRVTSYDVLNRIRSQTDESELGPLSTVTTYPDGSFQRVTKNPRGFETTTAFQVFDEPSEDHAVEITAQITASENVSVSIQRDLFNKATRITRSGGGNSATRSYVYDLHQRLCKTVEPETGATIQQYDLAGNVEWRASGLTLPGLTACDHGSVTAARKVNFTYDSRLRLTDSTFGDGSPSITRSYTRDGLLETLKTGTGTLFPTAWTYRYNNRRLLEQETLVSPNGTFVIGHSHNANGHTKSLTYPTGPITLDYSPNALGQPTRLSSGGTNLATEITYHPNGGVARYVLGNGVEHTTVQYPRGLPKTWSDAGLISDTYTYDENGNVKGITDGTLGRHRNLGYDGLDRLTTANGPWGTGSYTYDPLDNLRASQVGGRILTHAYDASTNRISGVTGSQNFSIFYDSQGNVTSRKGQGYIFDIGNRLRRATGPITADYQYDGHGRRVFSTSPQAGNKVFVYSMDGRLLQSSAAVKGINEGTTLYVHLGNKLLAQYNANTSNLEYVHTDALGTPVVRSQSGGGTEVAGSRRVHEPYGFTDLTAPSGVGFTGHFRDREIELVYMQQRYYDPIAGRFLSVDPVTTDAKTGRSFNRYVYAENNPYVFTDPDGRSAIVWRGMSLQSQVSGTGIWTGASGISEANQRITASLTQGVNSLPPQFQIPGMMIEGVRRSLVFSNGANSAQPPKNPQPITNPPQEPPIPNGWTVAPNPRRPGGIIATPPGAAPGSTDGEHIRVDPPGSSPVAGLDDGYWRWNRPGAGWYDPGKGKFGGGQGQTHVPLPPGYNIPKP